MTVIRKAATGTAVALSSLLALATTASAMYAPSVLARNQKVTGSEVSIAYAYMPANGFLVIRGSQDNGKLGNKVLGQVALKAGDHRNIKVKLDGKVPEGTKLWAEIQPTQDASAKPFTYMGTPVDQSFKIL